MLLQLGRPGYGFGVRVMATLALLVATVLLSGCGCSATQSKYIFVNQTGAVAIVKVDGGAVYQTYAPGNSDSYCLERSTPHVLVITYHAIMPWGALGPPLGQDTKTIVWDAQAGWSEQRMPMARSGNDDPGMPLDE